MISNRAKNRILRQIGELRIGKDLTIKEELTKEEIDNKIKDMKL
jgi:hypothetical protein